MMSSRLMVLQRGQSLPAIVPWLFLIGYFVTASHLEGFALEYFALTIFAMVASWLLLIHIPKKFYAGLPIWLMFIVFIVAYFARFYWLAFNPDVGTHRHQLLPAFAASGDVLIETYRILVFAFVAFCLISILLLKQQKENSARLRLLQVQFIGVDWRNLIPLLFILVSMLILITSYTMYVTRIAVMAAESVYLPFRLAGIVFYTASVVVPGLLLLLIWVTDRKNLKRWFLLALLLLILYGVIQFFIRSTRGMLLNLFILTLFLFLVTGNLTKGRLFLGGAIALVTDLLFPTMSAYRFIRAGDPELRILPAFLESFSILPEIDLWDTFMSGFYMLLFRFTGVESLMMIIGRGFQPLGYDGFNQLFMFGGPGLARIFTLDMEGMPEYAIHSSAPSFLGWFYMLGGPWFTMVGVAVFVLIVWSVWSWLLRANLKCLPVAQALFLMLVLAWVTDGVLDRFYWGALTTAVALVPCEFFLRTVGKARWLPIKSQQLQGEGRRA